MACPLVVLLLAAACGQTRQEAAEETANTTTTAPTTAPTTSTTVAPTTTTIATTTTTKTATVQQVASVVAKYEPDLRTYIREIEPCIWPDSGCSLVTPITFLTLSYATSAFSRNLSDLPKPGSMVYVGAIPQEIAGLHMETVSAAETVKELAKTSSDDQCATPAATSACDAATLSLAMSALEAQLDAWTPYL